MPRYTKRAASQEPCGRDVRPPKRSATIHSAIPFAIIPKPDPSFGSMPEELVLRVFKYLNLESLACVARVNHQCNRIACEILYEHCHSGMRGIESFLETIQRNKVIGGHVKAIKWEYGEERIYPNCMLESLKMRYANSATDRGLLKNYDRAWMTSDYFKWRPHLLESTMFHAPNIRKLQVKAAPLYDTAGWVQMLTDAAFGQTPPHINNFHRLQHLEISMSYGDISLRPIVGILRLPSLTSLVLEDFVETTEITEFNLPVRESNVTHLKLHYGFIDNGVFYSLMGAFKNLQCVEFDQLNVNWWPQSGWKGVAWPVVGAAITLYKDTLKHINIIYDKYTDLWDEEDEKNPPDWGIIGSLRDFKALENMHIPMYAFGEDFFVGDVVDCLPPGLLKLFFELDIKHAWRKLWEAFHLHHCATWQAKVFGESISVEDLLRRYKTEEDFNEERELRGALYE